MLTMKTKVKQIIYKSMPKNFKYFIRQEILKDHEYFKYMNHSFSQEGEDQILSQFFYGVDQGFFVDIGAHHPIKYSNTYKFYLRGWRGINIDVMPGSMAIFNHIRPEDNNLEIGISDTGNCFEYFMFEQSGLNTFSKDMANKQIQQGYNLVKSITVNTMKMEDVLNEYLPGKQHIDFLSLDVEGFELEALRSNNWNKFRPKMILLESLDLINKNIFDNFFHHIEYEMVAQTKNNLFYLDHKRSVS